MEKELVGLFEAAKKAADAAAVGGASSNGPEVARCIDALKQLGSIPVTRDALVSTEVGKKLRHLTKHPRGKIKTMATELLEAWKKGVMDEDMRSKKNGSNDGKSSIKTEVSKAETIKVEKNQESSTVKVKKISNVETVKIEKKNNGESKKSGISGRLETVKVEKKEVDTGMTEKRDRAVTVKVEKKEVDTGMTEKRDRAVTVKVEKKEVDTGMTEKRDWGVTVKIEKKELDTSMTEKRDRGVTVKVEKKEVDTGMTEKRDWGETVKVEKISREEKKPSQAPTTPKLSKLSKCNDSVRDKFREVLCEALSKVASEAGESRIDEVNACDPFHVAVSVESALFEKLGKSTGMQKSKYRSIMFNLKDQNNPDFRRKVLLGEIKPERLITMTPEEMASDQRQRENTEIKKKALIECERGAAPKATTDQFKCSRCGQRQTTYHQMQTRSADEPMTTYVTCVVCGKNWKFC